MGHSVISTVKRYNYMPQLVTLAGIRKTWVLGFYLVLGFIGISDFFHLHEKLGIFLVDLAHQLSFYLHMTVL